MPIIEVESCRIQWLYFDPYNNMVIKILNVRIVLVTRHGLGGIPFPHILRRKLLLSIYQGIFTKIGYIQEIYIW